MGPAGLFVFQGARKTPARAGKNRIATMEGKSCGICGEPRARAYRVSGMLLRHLCANCFASRCVHCGAICVDKEGSLLKGATMGAYKDQYCKKCSRQNVAQKIKGELPPGE